MKKQSIVILLSSAIAVMFLFQNCGAFDSASSTSSSNSEQSGGGEAFLAGQDFDPALSPFDLNDAAVAGQLNNYVNHVGFKAIAVNADGEGFISSTSDGLVLSQAEWDRVILERCQIRFENKPCSLLASGDTFAQNESDFLTGYSDQFLDIPLDFDPLRLPGVIDHWRNYNLTDYLPNINGNIRALAVDNNGGSMAGWSSGANASQAEADRRALEFCESISYGNRPCFLHTQETTTIWDPTNTLWEPARVRWAPGVLDINDIPFITEGQRDNQLRAAVDNFTTNGGNLIIVMGRFGRYAAASAPAVINNVSRAVALQTCDDLLVQNQPAAPGGFQQRCFIYSENGQIVMTPDTFGRAAHHWHPDNRL